MDTAGRGALIANTLRLPCRANRVVSVSGDEDVARAIDVARRERLPIRALGDGSNVVLPPSLRALVLRVADDAVSVLDDSPTQVTLRVGAGKNWHALVEETLCRGWYGLENLALIPGRVGAAPVQNIGAYGRELRDFTVAVHGSDLRTARGRSVSARQCEFAYRDSVFKRRLRDRVLIRAVDLRLSKTPDPHLAYPALRERLKSGPYPETPRGVFDAVVAQRRQRLPDPARRPNAGSFFKNPVLAAALVERLARRFPDLPRFAQREASAKLSAAWLIERCGLRGERQGQALVSATHALVVENAGGATQADVLALAERVQARVYAAFGVQLVREPRVMAADAGDL